ncbi:MAG: hypothetical protein E7181_02025 [Erysipelotrichaceae bacterium]|nr:hypothetical protein [Erysipelotrichaceae bacterium]
MEAYFVNNKPKRNFKIDFSFLKNINSLFYYAVLLLLVGFAFYFLMLVENGFILSYGGDFTAQYVPMGYHIWDYYYSILTTGHITLFDETIYLGASTIGSDAYYGLFSPFNIILLIFPRPCVPYVIGLMSIIKLMVAGLLFRYYLKYMGCKEFAARLGGISYAFVGWMAFYLWYNNYQDVLVFFPIVLLGIEKVIREKKPWLLAFGLFLLTISNYVLMISYIIAAFFYAMFRYFQTIRTRSLKDNLWVILFGFLGFSFGLLLTGTILVPAFFATINSPKVSSNSYWLNVKTAFKDRDFGLVFSYIFNWEKAKDQHDVAIGIRAYYPILNFFFPATTDRSMPTLKYTGWDFDDLCCSLWVYLPNILFLVPALIDSARRKKFSHLIAAALLTLTLCTPFMYYLFMGMVNAYARWTLFVTSSIITYVSLYISDLEHKNRHYIHFGYAFAIAGIIATYILTLKLPEIYQQTGSRGTVVKRFLVKDFDYTHLAYGIELGYATLAYILLFIFYNKKKFVQTFLTCMVVVEAVVMGTLVSNFHGWDTKKNNGYSINNELHDVINRIKGEEKVHNRFFTSFNDAYSDENTMMNGYSSGSYFHSLYNFNVDYFTRWSRMRSGVNSVGGRYRGKIQDLDTFLNMKYYVLNKGDLYSKSETIKQAYGAYRGNVPLGFEEVSSLESENFTVYKNPLYPDFGFSYDTVFAYNEEGEKDFSKIYTPSSRDEYYIVYNGMAYLKTAIMSYEDSKEITTLTNKNISLYEENIYSNPTIHDLSISGYSSSSSAKYQVKFYKTEGTGKTYPVKDIVSIPNTLPEVTYEEINPMHYFAFITKKDGTAFDYFDEGQSLYIHAPFSGSVKYDIYLIDENNKIFTYDDHSDHSTDNPSPIRGFYTDRKIKAIAYCGKYGSSNSVFRIKTESGKDYFERLNNRLQYPIEVISYKADKWSFKTNYDKERFVISKEAYDDGWHVYSYKNGQKKELKKYLSMGGFVGFISEVGECEYTMEYVTPYRNVGVAISWTSFIVYLTSLLVYQRYVFEGEKNRFTVSKEKRA